MYNENLKERFLDEIEGVEGTKRNYWYILNKAEKTESDLNKDVYDFTPEEADALLYSYSARSDGMMFIIISCMKQYIDWCKINNFTKDNFNYFSTLNNIDIIRKYVNMTAMQNQYITLEELIELEEQCINWQDIVVPELLFAGVKGERAIELLELKENQIVSDRDVNNLEINPRIVLSDREIPISHRTYEIIKSAMAETEYKRGNGDTEANAFAMIINPNDHVVKPAGKTKGGILSYSALNTRIERIKKYFNNPYLSVTNFWISGQIHLAKQIKAEKGKLKKEDYQYINHMFGIGTDYWNKTRLRIERCISIDKN